MAKEKTNEEWQEMIERFNTFFQKKYHLTDNGKIQSNTSRRFFKDIEVYTEYCEAMEAFGEEPLELGAVQSIINAEIKHNKEKNTPAVQEVDLEEYIIDLVKKTGRFEWNRSGSQFWSKKPGSNGRLNADINDVMNAIGALRVKDPILEEQKIGDIKCIVFDHFRRDKENCYAQLTEELKFDKTKQTTMVNVLKKIHEHFQVREDFRMFTMMMCHWAWQVKRRLYNKKVVWHIWINLFGPTGTGKTWLINSLCKPFDDFYVGGAKISDLLNETKEIKKFTEAVIVYFDELAVNKKDATVYQENLSQDDIKTLKSILTSDKLNTRIYGTQEQMKRDITFTCISSANEHLYDVIYDPETMRRYFEFNCDRAEIGSDAECESLNKVLEMAKEFWQGIDENRERGYWDPNGELGKKVWEIQKNYYPTRSTITSMASHYDFVYDPQISPIDSYKNYTDWCKSAGHKSPKVIDSWANEIKRRWPNLIGKDGYPHIRYTNERQFNMMFSAERPELKTPTAAIDETQTDGDAFVEGLQK